MSRKAGERVATLEIGFLDRLVTRLASAFAARPHNHDEHCDCACTTLIDTFITVAENRFGFLSTAVYKHLLKKLVQRVDDAVHDTVLAPAAVQEIVFFLDVFRQALLNYQLKHGIVAVEVELTETKQEVDAAAAEESAVRLAAPVVSAPSSPQHVCTSTTLTCFSIVSLFACLNRKTFKTSPAPSPWSC